MQLSAVFCVNPNGYPASGPDRAAMAQSLDVNGGRVVKPLDRRRVAVVGCGMGGLVCARELRLHGFEPTVFETANRRGGRCSSRMTSAGLFDDGAQSFSEHAGRSITPTSLAAHFWRHGVVATRAVTPRGSLCLWDCECRIGVCGDRVVASRLELVRRSGVDLARAIAGSMLQSSRHIVMPWPKIVARNGSSLAIQQAEAAACRESE